MVVQLFRYLLVQRFHKSSPTGDSAIPWERWFAVTTAVSGLMWGLAGVFLFPADHPEHQLFLAVAVAGISSAASIVYCARTECYLPTVLAALVPLSARYFYEGSEIHMFMGAVILLYAIVLCLTGRQMNALNTNTLKLGFEKNDLIASLTEQKNMAEGLNEKLMSEIEERLKAEQKTKASLAEKEVLLKEIHHRVKNNLQIMSSLLRLQSRTLKDKAILDKLVDAESRVRSMALVHERLYRSESLADLDVSEYVDGLVSHLMGSYAADNTRIKVDTEIDSVSFGIETAIPFGFILTELFCNCLKHAFPEGREGRVKIHLQSTSEEDFVLLVADNGVGIKEQFESGDPKSLGLHLVDILARQLGGRFELARDCGTEIKVRFKDVGRGQMG
jgi:two-component sensor histidine kinase